MLQMISVVAATCACAGCFSFIFLGLFLSEIRQVKSRRNAGFEIALASNKKVFVKRTPRHALCVLGSGGHTAELFTMISDLLQSKSAPCAISYVSTSSDNHSIDKVSNMHCVESISATHKPTVQLFRVPRAREVGQSWLISLLASVRCFFAALPLLLKISPDILIVNGPGTSVVVVLVALVCNSLRLTAARCIYVESVARTKNLSLSGRILYHVVHRFIVQWPSLTERYPLSEYHGRIS